MIKVSKLLASVLQALHSLFNYLGQKTQTASLLHANLMHMCVSLATCVCLCSDLQDFQPHKNTGGARVQQAI